MEMFDEKTGGGKSLDIVPLMSRMLRRSGKVSPAYLLSFTATHLQIWMILIDLNM
jgi:hypothetical protein